ncbi:MAG: fasciclin domain-containing protein, partial [Woeseiaceae bacterium]
MKSLRIFCAFLITIALASPAIAHQHGNKGMNIDIVETAANAGTFNTLIAAAKAAGLVDALKGDGPLTVFAPTDEAFSALPAGT